MSLFIFWIHEYYTDLSLELFFSRVSSALSVSGQLEMGEMSTLFLDMATAA